MEFFESTGFLESTPTFVGEDQSIRVQLHYRISQPRQDRFRWSIQQTIMIRSKKLLLRMYQAKVNKQKKRTVALAFHAS